MSLYREALAAALALRGRVARVVVAEARGSAPREPGAAMLVWPGGQEGTIGGGALEWEAAAAACALLARPSAGPCVVRRPLGPALGQCCGGAVTLVTEVFDAVPAPEPVAGPGPDAGAPFGRRAAPAAPEGPDLGAVPEGKDPRAVPRRRSRRTRWSR